MNEKLYAVYFEPEDCLAFRESRRFNPGDTAKSVFPSPFPFYGAVRTALLKEYGIELQYHKKPILPQELLKKLGDETQPGVIKLIGPFIFSESNGKKKHYFPAPKNVYAYKVRKDGTEKIVYETMRLFNEDVRVENLQLGLAWVEEEETIETGENYIELEELVKLQSGQNFTLCKASNFVEETKLGIALEKSEKRASEGKLYTLRMYRFKNGGFFMLTDSEETVQEISKIKGVFLGSKQRWCSVKIEPFEKNIFQRINSKNVAIMLLTPAIYSNGIAPEGLSFDGIKIRAIAAGKKIVVSGWDYASGKPKPIYHAVSPGTVYYLDKTPPEKYETNKTLQGDEIIIKQSLFSEFGFGHFVYLPYEFVQQHEGGIKV